MTEFISTSDLTLTTPPKGKQVAVARSVDAVASVSDAGESYVEGKAIKAENPLAVETQEGNRSIWDIAFPTTVIAHQGGALIWYQEELILRSPKLFIPAEPFEYTLDSTNQVKELTKLALTYFHFTSAVALLRVAGFINVPSTVNSFSPKLNIRCLAQPGQKWFAARRCQITVYTTAVNREVTLAAPGYEGEGNTSRSSSPESVESFEMLSNA